MNGFLWYSGVLFWVLFALFWAGLFWTKYKDRVHERENARRNREWLERHPEHKKPPPNFGTSSRKHPMQDEPGRFA